jgi:transcriptional regulator with XRE-family HTH domain
VSGKSTGNVARAGDNSSGSPVGGPGRRLREIRLQRDLSLQEVASNAGISASMLSQLERGIVVPSLLTLHALAEYFNIALSDLFIESPSVPRGQVLAKKDRPVIRLPGSDATYELLSTGPRRSMQVIEVILAPGGSTAGAPDHGLTHTGEECIVVISGTVSVSIGGERFVLRRGDSLYFDATLSHRYEAMGKSEAHLLATMVPPAF